MNNLGEIPQNLRREVPAKVSRGSIQRAQMEEERKKENVQVKDTARFTQQITSVTDSNSQPVLNDNAYRKYLLVQNNGTTDVYINFGVKANTGNIKIIAGGNYEPATTPTNSIYLVSGAGNINNCAVVEGVEI